MADQKISELTALTGANVADDDAIAIVDTSATETKKIVFSELKSALDTATGFVRITGDTMTGALDVQSTITSDGLTVDGAIAFNSTATFSDGSEARFGADNDMALFHSSGVNHIRVNSGIFKLRADDMRFTAQNGTSNKLTLDSNGDISFYEDTGTTAKFFWDASAESLGIGTSSPSKKAHLYASNDSASLRLENTANSKVWDITPARPGVANTGLSIHNVTDDRIDLHVDNSGNVGIGTSSPDNNANFTAMTIESTSGSGGGQVYVKSSTATGVFGADNAGSGAKVILQTNTSHPLVFGTANTERMRLTSAGSVGIGTSSPSEKLEVSGNIFVNTSGNPSMIVKTSGAGNNPNYRLQADTNYWDLQGTFSNANDELFFMYNGSVKMGIDSSGNLLVGGTSAYGTSTFTADSGGQIKASASTRAAIFNRHDSDGDIVEFRKADSTVGSIGSTSGVATYSGSTLASFGAGDVGLFANPSNNAVYPVVQTTLAGSNGLIDLGLSGNRFKDLYLSGGVYLGGTGAANKLDDYEEGTWVPAPRGSSVAGSVTGTNFYGIYTKIGRQVTVNFDCDYSALTGASGTLEIHGLPYTVLAGSETVGAIMVDGMNFNSSLYTQLTLYAGGGGTKMLIFMSGDDLGWAVQGVVDEQTGIRGTLTYMTA